MRVSPAWPRCMASVLLLKVPECARPPGARRASNAAMMSARPPKAPKATPPPSHLPSVLRSGLRPSTLASPPAESRDVATSSRMKSTPAYALPVSAQLLQYRRPRQSHLQRRLLDAGQELGCSADAAGGGLHALDEHGGDARAPNRLGRALQIIVLGNDAVVDVDVVGSRLPPRKGQHAAVVAVGKDDNLALLGKVACRGQGVQVGLGARAGESDELQPKALADGARKEPLLGRGSAHVQADVVKDVPRDALDYGVSVAVEAGGEVSKEINEAALS
ncbi:hypothetical protein G6O67_002501 [Ophiocordyceps sinensis]|uniref:Uncharacterized protein n=1 Tax=Ophiocordyceps sinensis TaxID=72228 RepID=A0A8H4PU97_9HYPO|nr:hypothetical protein G6O67_002501 [Ophiocordyceps sinensis]